MSFAGEFSEILEPGRRIVVDRTELQCSPTVKSDMDDFTRLNTRQSALPDRPTSTFATPPWRTRSSN